MRGTIKRWQRSADPVPLTGNNSATGTRDSLSCTSRGEPTANLQCIGRCRNKPHMEGCTDIRLDQRRQLVSSTHRPRLVSEEQKGTCCRRQSQRGIVKKV